VRHDHTDTAEAGSQLVRAILFPLELVARAGAGLHELVSRRSHAALGDGALFALVMSLSAVLAPTVTRLGVDNPAPSALEVAFVAAGAAVVATTASALVRLVRRLAA